jgi:hypothetical protein
MYFLACDAKIPPNLASLWRHLFPPMGAAPLCLTEGRVCRLMGVFVPRFAAARFHRLVGWASTAQTVPSIASERMPASPGDTRIDCLMSARE